MEHLVTGVGWYIYRIPLPDMLKDTIAGSWFSDDWHHLSNPGHNMVANGVLELLSYLQDDVFKPKHLSSSDLGDQCYNWFLNRNEQICFTDVRLVNNDSLVLVSGS